MNVANRFDTEYEFSPTGFKMGQTVKKGRQKRERERGRGRKEGKLNNISLGPGQFHGIVSEGVD
jgi:hypothetical protein